MRSSRYAIALGILLCSSMLCLPAHADDEADVRAVMAKMGDAWKAHDMQAWTSYMTDDVEWVNIVGMWWHGRAEVFQAHDAFFKTIFKDRAFGPPGTSDLRRIAPDAFVLTTVAVAGAYTTPSGEARPAARNILTQTFVKRDGKWLMAAGQNTVINEAAVSAGAEKK